MRIDELINYLQQVQNPHGRVSVKVSDLDYPMVRLDIHEDGVVLIGAKDGHGSMVLKTTDHQCGATIEVPDSELLKGSCHLPAGHKGDHEGWCFGSRATAPPQPGGYYLVTQKLAQGPGEH